MPEETDQQNSNFPPVISPLPSAVTNITDMPSIPKKNIRKNLLFVSIIFVAVGVTLTTTFFTAVAYRQLPVGTPKFRAAVSQVIVGLPFMPKTPEYVVEKAVLEGIAMKRFVIDMSVAVDLPQMMESGMGDFFKGKMDMTLKGPVDLTDMKKLKANLNFAFTKDFNTDLRFLEDFFFFKINRFPPMLGVMLSSYGITENIQKQFMNRWFYVDMTPINSEARQSIDETPSSGDWQTEVSKKFDQLLKSEKVHPKNTLTEEKVDGFLTYKVVSEFDDATVDAFVEMWAPKQRGLSLRSNEPKPHETFTKVKLTTWVDKQSFITRKMAFSTVVKVPESSAYSYPGGVQLLEVPVTKPATNDMPVSFVVKYSNIGQEVTIEKPKDAVRFEEFASKAIDATRQSSDSANIGAMYTQSNNTKRKADVASIMNALQQYIVANPSSLSIAPISTAEKTISKEGTDLCSILVPEYIGSLPVDPNINMGREITKTDCASNYFTGYRIRKNADDSFTITAPYAELGEKIEETR